MLAQDDDAAHHRSADERAPGTAARTETSVAAAPRGTAVARALRTSATLLLVGAIRAYQLVLSPWIGNRCRHEPTCSAYALEAIRRFGPLHGVWVGAKRIARCHPWGTWGYDPVADPDAVRQRDGNRTSAP